MLMPPNTSPGNPASSPFGPGAADPLELCAPLALGSEAMCMRLLRRPGARFRFSEAARPRRLRALLFAGVRDLATDESQRGARAAVQAKQFVGARDRAGVPALDD